MIVCERDRNEKKNPSTGEIEVIKKISELISDDRSLRFYAKEFSDVRKAEGINYDQYEDEA